MTPALRSAAVSCATMLKAPRILKAPAGCRFSHLRKSARWAASETSTSGVTRASGLMRSAAARISSRVTNCVVVEVSAMGVEAYNAKESDAGLDFTRLLLAERRLRHSGPDAAAAWRVRADGGDVSVGVHGRPRTRGRGLRSHTDAGFQCSSRDC